MASENHTAHLIKFGIHLQTIRKSKNLSLRKLAAKCNIDHADIQQYEKGLINMSFNSLIELSEGLEVSLKDLMDF
ncbi:helix-turn-helix transcriptional regulator [Mucilaginibacter rigui]|uniref:Helix-turn-helix transcriptional regulator n=1 Tax=Mucilaginibacter rigui TaxID=534635 RepID=A0ABR7X5W3_9SPHI|nr:helix-turn-helix transcriptional regulator [Mucilaginibacter rigui]